MLAHGIARPDHLIDSLARTLNLSLYDFSLVSDRFHYFKGIASFLKKRGVEVYHSSVSFAADVDTRARDLKKEVLRILEKSGKEKVHIIAHSMGGLDARHMIVNEQMSEYVATLTTIGTPHKGTPVAKSALEIGMDGVINRFRKILNLEGIRSVTPANCRNFNRRAREEEATNSVEYRVYYSSKKCEDVFLPFQLTYKIVEKQEGANDGLVSLKSQKWVRYLKSNSGKIKPIIQRQFPIPADHLDQIGWWNLNEIHKAGWWNMKALRAKNQHEMIIKRVYLEIAREVTGLATPIRKHKRIRSRSKKAV